MILEISKKKIYKNIKMNTSACINEPLNVGVTTNNVSETSVKKKIYNDRYQEKRRQALEQIKQIKTVLGITELEVERLPEYIKERDDIISQLRIENQRLQEEKQKEKNNYTEELQRKEIETMKLKQRIEEILRENQKLQYEKEQIRREKEVIDERRETKQEIKIDGVQQQIAKISEYISKIQNMDKIIAEEKQKADTYEATYYFLLTLKTIHPNTFNDTLRRLKEERKIKPITPVSLDHFIAINNVDDTRTGVSPPPPVIVPMMRM